MLLRSGMKNYPISALLSWRRAFAMDTNFKGRLKVPTKDIAKVNYSGAVWILAIICGSEYDHDRNQCSNEPQRKDTIKAIQKELAQIYQQRDELIKKKQLIDVELSELRQYQRQLEASLREKRSVRKTLHQDNKSATATSIDQEIVFIGSKSYRLKQRIGAGSFGIVSLAENLDDPNEKIAIKRCRVSDEASVYDLQHELAVLNRINELGGHRNVVRLIGSYEDDSQLYVATELLNGGELFNRIVKHGTVEEKEAVKIIRQLADALDFLHCNGITHCDMKPENVLLCANEDSKEICVKLIDFGSAAVKDLSPGQFCDTRTTAYCPPEILLGGSFSPAADMWAVGCIMYIILSGKHPFDSSGRSTKGQIEANVLTQQVTFTHKEWARISEQAKDVIVKLITSNAQDRLTAKDLLNSPWIKSSG